MSAPKRWLDDPKADPELRAALRSTPRARSLDDVTRRRLSAKVARASALPAVAAGWLFVKSATAALGVVLGAGAIASYTGVIEVWSPARPEPSTAPPSRPAPRATHAAPAPSAVTERLPEVAVTAPAPLLNPSPSLPVASSNGSGTLSMEAALLEQARREMRGAPAVALSIAQEHAERFPRGQLAAERTLIQIEALHRLGRDTEATKLARPLLAGASRSLYEERVRKLLGDAALP